MTQVALKYVARFPAPQTGRRHENSGPATLDVLSSHCRRSDVIHGHDIIFHQEHLAVYLSGNRYNLTLSRIKCTN